MSLIPLESNPEVMNKFLHLLGVPNKWKIVDVYGLDDDILLWVPRPVLALILLFPCSEQFYKHAEQEASKLKETGQVLTSDLFYMKQYVSNACGTIALIHCVANNIEALGLQDGPFKKLLNDAKTLTPEQRGEMLLNSKDNEALNLISAHQVLAMEGQTQVTTNLTGCCIENNVDEALYNSLLIHFKTIIWVYRWVRKKANPNVQVNHHFVALVEKGGYLYELDGRKEFPINHGATTQETFLKDAAKVCREFISRDAEDVNFTLMALSASDN